MNKNALHRNSNYCFFILVVIAMSLLQVATPTSALTYQSSTDVEFTLNPTISITLSDPNLIIDDLTPGSSSDSNIITATVSTNAGYGYYMSVTAGTTSTDTNLTSPTGSIFTNLSSNAATLSSFPDNHWGYSYSTDNGTTWISGSQGNTNTGYNGLPLDNDDSGATGVILNSTDSFTNSGSVKFKIGAKASPSQASGTYTNTVNFYAVANPEPQLGPESCEPGNICYHVNSLTATEGTMGRQNRNEGNRDITDGSSVTLLASNFSKYGYGFAGWSDTYDYTGNLYGPQETITVPTGTTANGLSLYAIWIKSEGSLQNSAKVAQVCNRLTAATLNTAKTLNSVSALTDQRDNQTYAIAKLADGKCWMIENLRLNDTANHNSDGSLAQGYGVSTTYGSFVGLAAPEFASGTSAANSIYYYGTQSGDATVDIGTVSFNPLYRMPRYNNATTINRAKNPTSNVFTYDSSLGGLYSYGNYYSWAAAMANTIYYGSPTYQDASSKASETVNTSLCPRGWRLPYGNSSGNGAIAGGYSYLDSSLGGTGISSSTDTSPTGAIMSNRWRSFPNNFLYAGELVSETLRLRGSGSTYWTSTAESINGAYSFSITSSKVNPAGTGQAKYVAGTIRCIVGP